MGTYMKGKWIQISNLMDLEDLYSMIMEILILVGINRERELVMEVLYQMVNGLKDGGKMINL